MKMRIVRLALDIACCLLVLSGCQGIPEINIGNIKIAEILCRHEWADATCEVPQLCTKCGKTEGDALGHNWADATCETPKTCSVCSQTEGDALGHDWLDATCETPKTCSVCSQTEGNALGHDWLDATCEAPQTCSVCSVTNGDPSDHAYGPWQLNGIDVDRTRECEICGSTESQPFDAQATVAEILRNTKWTAAYLTGSGSTINVIDSFGSDFASLTFDDAFGMVDTFDGISYTCVWEHVKCEMEDSTYLFVIASYTVDTHEPVEKYIIILDPTAEVALTNPSIVIPLNDGMHLYYGSDEILFGSP